MTDKEIFERFMEWMGMSVANSVTTPDGTELVRFYDTGRPAEAFTTQGYDEFFAGAEFRKDGSLIRGYVDSHVAYTSNNCTAIEGMLKQMGIHDT